MRFSKYGVFAGNAIYDLAKEFNSPEFAHFNAIIISPGASVVVKLYEQIEQSMLVEDLNALMIDIDNDDYLYNIIKRISNTLYSRHEYETTPQTQCDLFFNAARQHNIGLS